MKSVWRMRRLANAGAWSLMFFAAGIMAGILVVAMLPGMPWAATMFDVATNAEAMPAADLAAQRGMASAAWWMVAITGVSSAVGGAGLFLIYRTLFEARRSARAAEVTAEHALSSLHYAEETVNVARAMGIAQTRSYLTVSSIVGDFREGMSLHLKVKNSGATPAQIVRMNCTPRIEIETADGPLHVVPLAPVKFVLPDIAANDSEEIQLQLPQLSVDEEEAFNNERAKVLVTGSVSHRDIFGDDHPYTFGFECKPPYDEVWEKKWRMGRIPIEDSALHPLL